jgi:hypothetical protein
MIDCGDRALDMPKAGVLTGKSSGGIHGQKQSDAFSAASGRKYLTLSLHSLSCKELLSFALSY